MGCQPNTLFVGAAKSGTTSLCNDLALHPNIYLYRFKETNYFSFNFHRGEAWFQSLFSPDGERIVMDGSPDYTTRGKTSQLMQRIKDSVPKAQLILMVRHPIRRLESHYVQELANGRTPIPFHEALTAWDLIDGSLYEKATKIILEYFPPHQLHTLFFEDYLTDKTAALRSLFTYLQIADHPPCYALRAATNTRTEKIVDTKLLKQLRRLPGFQKVKKHMSSHLKVRVKSLISTPVKAQLHWTPEAWERAHATITPDMAAFLRRHGKPLDYWNLHTTPH